MKIRNGFVSNSSSSSFVLIGEKVKAEELTEEDFQKKIVFCNSKVYGNDSVMADYITKEQFDLLEEVHNKLIFYKDIKSVSSSYEIDVKKLTSDKKYYIFSNEIDYYFDIDYILEELNK